MFELWVDTYATEKSISAILADHCTWQSLTPAQRRNSIQSVGFMINSLDFYGIKKSPLQNLEFPRIFGVEGGKYKESAQADRLALAIAEQIKWQLNTSETSGLIEAAQGSEDGVFDQGTMSPGFKKWLHPYIRRA